MRLKLCIFTLLCSISSLSLAVEQVNLCVRYWRPSYSSWSKGYEVNAYVLDASEINEATRSYHHSYSKKYVLIEWENGGYSVIPVPTYESFISIVYAEDQHRRQWQLQNTFVCH